jgi:hypothetical protein
MEMMHCKNGVYSTDQIRRGGADGGVHGLQQRGDGDRAVVEHLADGGGRPRAAVAAGGDDADDADAAAVVLSAVPLHREPRVLLADPLHDDGGRRRTFFLPPRAAAAARLAAAGLRPHVVPEIRGRGRRDGAGNARGHRLLRAAVAHRPASACAAVAGPPPRSGAALVAAAQGVQGVQRGSLAESTAAARRTGAEDGQDGHRAHGERARGNARPGARRGAPAGGRRRRAAAATHQQPAPPHDLGAAAARAAQRELRGSQSSAPSRIQGTSQSATLIDCKIKVCRDSF